MFGRRTEEEVMPEELKDAPGFIDDDDPNLQMLRLHPSGIDEAKDVYRDLIRKEWDKDEDVNKFQAEIKRLKEKQADLEAKHAEVTKKLEVMGIAAAPNFRDILNMDITELVRDQADREGAVKVLAEAKDQIAEEIKDCLSDIDAMKRQIAGRVNAILEAIREPEELKLDQAIIDLVAKQQGWDRARREMADELTGKMATITSKGAFVDLEMKIQRAYRGDKLRQVYWKSPKEKAADAEDRARYQKHDNTGDNVPMVEHEGITPAPKAVGK